MVIEMKVPTEVIYEELWLTYYNDTLRSKGLITEREHRAMKLLIHRRTKDKVKECYQKKPS